MKYKVGDKVRIKSLDWYNENKNSDDNYNVVFADGWHFSKPMSKFCGNELIIERISHATNPPHYIMKDNIFGWTDEMIEGLAEEENQPKFKVGDRVKWYNHTCDITSIDTSENTRKYLINNFDYREDKVLAKWVPEGELTVEDDEETSTKLTGKAIENNEMVIGVDVIEELKTYRDNIKGAWICPEGYKFKDENGNIINATKIVLEKKKKEYPKTYEECCFVLHEYPTQPNVTGYKHELLHTFRKLLICRDAYWKIAGEEMGLGKPWEPDWLDDDTKKYVITSTKVFKTFGGLGYINYILTFPTAEMRDYFYENFKELIESVKELL